MVANLKFKNDHYICTNCQMRQSGIPHQCQFCGCYFSNFEETLIEYKAKQYQAEIINIQEDLMKYEEDL